MKSIKDILSNLSFFEGLSEDMLEYIAGCGSNMHFAPNEFIGKENDDADYLYIIRKGKVAVQINHPVKGPLTIATLQDGDIAGFSWIIPPYRLQFNLLALDHSSIVALDGKCMRGKCDEDHHLGYLLMKQSSAIMMKRLHDARIQLLDVYSARV